MAENRKVRQEEGPLDFRTESARKRKPADAVRTLRSSPRKKKGGKSSTTTSQHRTPNKHTTNRHHEFSNDSSGLHNSEEDEEEEVEEVRLGEGEGREQEVQMEEGGSGSEEEGEPPQKKVKRLLRQRMSKAQLDTSRAKSDQATLVTLHSVSKTLRNLLKLPKAHKWCYYEWFYSDVDQPLLERENDFCRCISEMFPELKTNKLTRVQWRYLRRLMGKPRRCSPTFFSEERALLEHRRRRVRMLQQQVHQGMICGSDFAAYKDIPDYIPQLLVVGTPVTARLHTERESGFFTGRIEAVDLDNHQYWVTFDRPGLGKHSIHDTEIKAASPPEYICISKLEASHQQSHWPHEDKEQQQSSTTPHSTAPHSLQPRTPPRPILPDATQLLSPELLPDPFLTSSPERRKLLSEPQGLPGAVPPKPVVPDRVGGFPVDFLRQVMQLSKLLSLKQQITTRLAQMNTEAEKAHARQKPFSNDFQRQYATLVVDLDDINKQLNQRLDSIRCHCDSMGYGSEINPPHLDVREQAARITESANNSLEASGSAVKDPHLISLVTKLTGLLLQIEVLSESASSLQVNTLTQSVEEIARCIQPANRSHFRDNVETPVTFIQSGMTPVGALHAFSAGTAPRTLTARNSTTT